MRSPVKEPGPIASAKAEMSVSRSAVFSRSLSINGRSISA
jgi:hypothetical protein